MGILSVAFSKSRNTWRFTLYPWPTFCLTSYAISNCVKIYNLFFFSAILNLSYYLRCSMGVNIIQFIEQYQYIFLLEEAFSDSFFYNYTVVFLCYLKNSLMIYFQDIADINKTASTWSHCSYKLYYKYKIINFTNIKIKYMINWQVSCKSCVHKYDEHYIIVIIKSIINCTFKHGNY